MENTIINKDDKIMLSFVTEIKSVLKNSRQCLENYLGHIIVNFFLFQIKINVVFMKKSVLMQSGRLEN